MLLLRLHFHASFEGGERLSPEALGVEDPSRAIVRSSPSPKRRLRRANAGDEFSSHVSCRAVRSMHWIRSALVVQPAHGQIDGSSRHRACLIGSHEDRHVWHLLERHQPSWVGPACEHLLPLLPGHSRCLGARLEAVLDRARFRHGIWSQTDDANALRCELGGEISSECLLGRLRCAVLPERLCRRADETQTGRFRGVSGLRSKGRFVHALSSRPARRCAKRFGEVRRSFSGAGTRSRQCASSTR